MVYFRVKAIMRTNNTLNDKRFGVVNHVAVQVWDITCCPQEDQLFPDSDYFVDMGSARDSSKD